MQPTHKIQIVPCSTCVYARMCLYIRLPIPRPNVWYSKTCFHLNTCAIRRNHNVVYCGPETWQRFNPRVHHLIVTTNIVTTSNVTTDIVTDCHSSSRLRLPSSHLIGLCRTLDRLTSFVLETVVSCLSFSFILSSIPPVTSQDSVAVTGQSSVHLIIQ